MHFELRESDRGDAEILGKRGEALRFDQELVRDLRKSKAAASTSDTEPPTPSSSTLS